MTDFTRLQPGATGRIVAIPHGRLRRLWYRLRRKPYPAYPFTFGTWVELSSDPTH